MEPFLYLTIIFILLFIAYQDFKERAIYWFLFPILFLLLFVLGGCYQPIIGIAENIGINSVFLLLQGLGVMVYLVLKNRSLTNPFHEYFGLGDFLFLVAITPAFSPVNYIFFYTVSLLLILIGYGTYVLISGNKKYPIPLAGLQAILFGMVFTLSLFCKSIELQNDDAIFYKYSWMQTDLSPN